MQKQITELANKIRRQQNKIMLIQITNAWKQAARYLKTNEKDIQYAKTPEHEPLNKEEKDQKIK